MKRVRRTHGINPVLSKEHFNYRWIFAALTLIMWSLLEEVVLQSSDLITNFFANHITHGENPQLLNFVSEANHRLADPNFKLTVGTIDFNAIAAASQIFVIIISVIFGLCYGIGVYTAQYFGAGKFQNLKDLVMFKILASVLVSLIAVLFIQLFSKELIGFIIKYKGIPKPSDGASHQEWVKYYSDQTAYWSINQGAKYLRYVCLSYPLLALELSFVTTLRETGRPMISFWVAFMTLFLTLLFLVFLVEPTFLGNFHGFGLLGCAYAVILGKLIQIVCLIVFVYWRKYEFIPNRITILNKIHVWAAFRKAWLIAVNELLWSFSMLMQVKLFAEKGIDVLTANAILSTFVGILLVPVYHGISAGVAVLVGNNLGNNKLRIAELNSKRLIWLTLGISASTALLLAIFGIIVGYIYSNIPSSIISLTQKFMWLYALAVPFLMLNGTLYSIIRAGGLSTIAFVMDSVYNWSVTIPFMALLIFLTPLDIVIIFVLVRTIESAKIFPSLFFYFRKKWVKNLVYKL